MLKNSCKLLDDLITENSKSSKLTTELPHSANKLTTING